MEVEVVAFRAGRSAPFESGLTTKRLCREVHSRCGVTIRHAPDSSNGAWAFLVPSGGVTAVLSLSTFLLITIDEDEFRVGFRRPEGSAAPAPAAAAPAPAPAASAPRLFEPVASAPVTPVKSTAMAGADGEDDPSEVPVKPAEDPRAAAYGLPSASASGPHTPPKAVASAQVPSPSAPPCFPASPPTPSVPGVEVVVAEVPVHPLSGRFIRHVTGALDAVQAAVSSVSPSFTATVDPTNKKIVVSTREGPVTEDQRTAAKFGLEEALQAIREKDVVVRGVEPNTLYGDKTLKNLGNANGIFFNIHGFSKPKLLASTLKDNQLAVICDTLTPADDVKALASAARVPLFGDIFIKAGDIAARKVLVGFVTINFKGLAKGPAALEAAKRALCAINHPTIHFKECGVPSSAGDAGAVPATPLTSKAFVKLTVTAASGSPITAKAVKVRREYTLTTLRRYASLSPFIVFASAISLFLRCRTLPLPSAWLSSRSSPWSPAAQGTASCRAASPSTPRPILLAQASTRPSASSLRMPLLP